MKAITLRPCEREKSKELLRKTSATKKTNQGLLEEMQGYCLEFCQELEGEMNSHLVGEEGTLESVIENTMSIIYENVEAIEIDATGQSFREDGDIGYIAESYLLVLRRKIDEEILGGKIHIYIFLEEVINEYVYNRLENNEDEIFWITDVRIEYEVILDSGEASTKSVNKKKQELFNSLL